MGFRLFSVSFGTMNTEHDARFLRSNSSGCDDPQNTLNVNKEISLSCEKDKIYLISPPGRERALDG